MKYTSTILAAASGSLAGATFSRNRGGQYVRRRAIPSNPNSEAQGIARTNLASAVASWTNTLTDAQRQAWSSYAQATPVIDPLGQQITLSGQQMFVRSQTVWLAIGQTSALPGPTDSGLGITPDFTTDPTVDASTQMITYEASTTDGVVTDHAVLYMSRPVPASRIPNHETKRIAGTDTYAVGIVAGDLPTPFAVTAGQRVRVTVRNVDTQGRLSAVSFRDIVVEA